MSRLAAELELEEELLELLLEELELELDDELELLDELDDELEELELLDDELELEEELELLDDELDEELLELDDELELLDEELLLELSGIRIISMIIQISTIILMSTSSLDFESSSFTPKSHLRKLIIASKKLSRHPLGSSVSSGLFPIPSCSLCSLPRRLTRI